MVLHLPGEQSEYKYVDVVEMVIEIEIEIMIAMAMTLAWIITVNMEEVHPFVDVAGNARVSEIIADKYILRLLGHVTNIRKV